MRLPPVIRARLPAAVETPSRPATARSATAPTSARRTAAGRHGALAEPVEERRSPDRETAAAISPQATATTCSRPARLGIRTISTIMDPTTKDKSRESRSRQAAYTPTATTTAEGPAVSYT